MLGTLGEWGHDVVTQYRTDGLQAAAMYAGRGVFSVGWLGVTSRWPLGTNVFERDWDVLVVLDACRLDALRTVAPEYDWLGPVDAMWSVGSSTHEWTSKTFTRQYADEIGRTGLVTANSFATKVFEERRHPPLYYSVPFDASKWNTVERSDFGYTEWCYEQHHDHEALFETTPPEHVTDRAIVAWRARELDRLVAHYLQPHRPFLARAVETGEYTEADDDPYAARKRGDLSHDELWGRYLDNLRYALDSVETLLENVDADRVAITADHGELLGELGVYEHPEGVPHPLLKRVPWAVTAGTDERTRDPPAEADRKAEYDAEEQLADLGYV